MAGMSQWEYLYYLNGIHKHMSLLFLITLGSLFHEARAVIQGPTDYCMTDTFEPRCDQNEVIMIEAALYGRMKPGKCFPVEQGNFGCSADVLSILDNVCSGRQACSVSAVNKEFILTQPCPGSVGYLSISYSCRKASMVKLMCKESTPAKITNANGLISTTHGAESMTKNCPIEVNDPQGRLLKFTIYNYMRSSGSACYEVAVIKEKSGQKSIHVCQSDPRTKEVMMTSSSHVTVTFSDFQIGDSVESFLLHYEAIGCPRPNVPPDTYMERHGDTVKIICNNSDNSWFIYCKNNKWTKHDRKCPSDWGISKIFKSDSSFPYGVFLTSFIGVGIGIFLGGFLLFLAVNAFQRHQRRLRQMYEAPPVIPDPDYKIYDTSKMDFTLVPGFATGRHTIPRHQMSPPPIPSQPPEDERRFSRHTYEKPKYNSTDNQPYAEA